MRIHAGEGGEATQRDQWETVSAREDLSTTPLTPLHSLHSLHYQDQKVKMEKKNMFSELLVEVSGKR